MDGWMDGWVDESTTTTRWAPPSSQHWTGSQPMLTTLTSHSPPRHPKVTAERMNNNNNNFMIIIFIVVILPDNQTQRPFHTHTHPLPASFTTHTTTNNKQPSDPYKTPPVTQKLSPPPTNKPLHNPPPHRLSRSTTQRQCSRAF